MIQGYADQRLDEPRARGLFDQIGQHHSQINKEQDLRVLTVVALLLLAGCTNTSKDLLSDSNNYDGNFHTDVSAQIAYRNLRDASRLCLEQSPMGTPITVISEFDADIRAGQITQQMAAQGVRLTISLVDIESASSTGAKIKLYTLKGFSVLGTKRPKLEQLKRWVLGDKTC